MTAEKDHPGVYIPPPLIYAGLFFLAKWLQHLVPLPDAFFHGTAARVAGAACIIAGLLFNLPAILQFFRTRNTLVTIRPAHSLQTTGIYSVSRNPMYISLALLYTGLAFLIGSWWHFILLPVLVLVVQEYIIKREESYLKRAFGEEYRAYQTRVRRWL